MVFAPCWSHACQRMRRSCVCYGNGWSRINHGCFKQEMCRAKSTQDATRQSVASGCQVASSRHPRRPCLGPFRRSYLPSTLLFCILGGMITLGETVRSARYASHPRLLCCIACNLRSSTQSPAVILPPSLSGLSLSSIPSTPSLTVSPRTLGCTHLAPVGWNAYACPQRTPAADAGCASSPLSPTRT